MNNLRDVFYELRGRFDGKDLFMRGGHQIMKTQNRKRPVPVWVTDVIKLQALLLRSFPKAKTNPKQRKQAGRWARVIHLYFRLNYTYSEVAEELGITPGHARMLIGGIRRVAKGYRYDGRGKLGTRLPGRPKKVLYVSP